MHKTADSIWNNLKNRRAGLEKRWEKYAAFTLPRLFTDSNWNEDTDELAQDWQSVGAQSVNHLVNKLILALFAPSRPFMRLTADPAWLAEVASTVPSEEVEAELANAEIAATKAMDASPDLRAKLYLTVANLTVLGNCVLYLPTSKTESVRVFNVAQYVVRRTGTGKIKQAVLRESVLFDELEPEVQQAVAATGAKINPETEVNHYWCIYRNDKGGYVLDQYVNSIKLPEDFSGSWKDEDELPYRFLVWNLKDGNNYGTGLVEDYASDFAGLSSLTEAQIKGAILASEYRWLVNPGGMTKVEDLQNSENGAALPGQEGDVSLIANSKPGDLQVVSLIASEYIQRIGRGFLLGSATTRDSERTTATEIRLQAQELETGLGGVYSNIAGGLQRPLAAWLLTGIGLNIKGTKIEVRIVTGLDALSRAGDLDNLRAALADIERLAAVRTVAPELKFGEIIVAIMVGHGLPANKYTKTAAEVAQDQQSQLQQQQAAEAQAAGVAAGVKQVEGTA